MIKEYFESPAAFLRGCMIATAGLWPDKLYLKIYGRLHTGKWLDIENPQTYTEKCQWMKLYYQRPELTTMVDKYEAKQYVANLIGQEYIVECYGVWDDPEDIDFDKLPNQFVLKATHNSGGFIICKDKSKLDKKAVIESLKKSLKHNHFFFAREWAYKNVKPRILAEKYMDSLLKEDTLEYKITCMGGKVEFVTICGGIAHAAYEQRTNDHYTRDWEKMDWYARYKPSGRSFEKTPVIEKMIELSEKITQGIPQVRADWYVHNGQIYFGELTFYTWSGFPIFTPYEYDKILGEHFILPKEKYIEKK